MMEAFFFFHMFSKKKASQWWKLFFFFFFTQKNLLAYDGSFFFTRKNLLPNDGSFFFFVTQKKLLSTSTLQFDKKERSVPIYIPHFREKKKKKKNNTEANLYELSITILQFQKEQSVVKSNNKRRYCS